MARARNIKPGLYKNEDLAECSIWARFIFPGLWMLADRDGRLEDRPKRIKGELLPFDNQDVEPLLQELATMKDAQGVPFIVRYQNADGRFIQISKFSTHQTPHYSEKKSVIKPPNFQETLFDERTAIPGGLRETGGDECSTIPGGLLENSGNQGVIKGMPQPPDSLIPDSLIPDTGKKKGGDPAPDERFETAWERYPKRSGSNPKVDALAQWRKRLSEGVDPAVIAAGVERYRLWCDSTGKTGQETVMQAKRFFGHGRPFEEDFALPRLNGHGANPRAGAAQAVFGDAGNAGEVIDGSARRLD